MIRRLAGGFVRSVAEVHVVPVAWATLLLVLGGCSLPTRTPVDAIDWSAQREQLAAIDDWSLRGRVAVKTAQGGGQGDLDWTQTGAATHIRVSGPFGAGAYDIRWDADSLSIDSRDKRYSRAWTGADAAGQFLEEALGWSFPAVSTRWWLIGLPDPSLPAQPVYEADGRLAAFEQAGWTVRYERHALTEGLYLPVKMQLQGPQARLRLVIDRWHY